MGKSVNESVNKSERGAGVTYAAGFPGGSIRKNPSMGVRAFVTSRVDAMAAVPRAPAGRSSCAGYSFVEMLVVTAIILILAAAVMPLAKVTAARQREAELRRALREIRTAVDKYKDAADSIV